MPAEPAPPAPAPDVVRDVILRDGRVLRLRSPTIDDRAAIERFFRALGAESRYLRFHGPGRPDWAAAHYAESDGDARVTLLAELRGEVVAIAGYDRLRQPGVAEVAFAVADDLQGHGLGTRLLEQLAELAAERGVERFVAEVLRENQPMIGVFEDAGFGVRRVGYGSEVTLTLDLEPSERLAERIEARDHEATVASLEPMLRPAAAVVVGVAADGHGAGAKVLENMRAAGYAGTLHAVNRPGMVAGLVPPPELAVITVPAPAVEAAATEAADAGARALVVISAGFADARDDDGRAREEGLLAAVRERGVRMLGPNSLGIMNLTAGIGLNASVARAAVRPGRMAVASQSGGLGMGLLGHATVRDLGVAGFAAVGNRADVSINDLLEWWEDDPDVAGVLLYVESFGNPRRFVQIARRVSQRKPIVAVKGTTRVRSRMTGSHTGAALTVQSESEALFAAAGVLHVEGAGELFDLAGLLQAQPLPAGRRVAVVSNSAGLGGLARDALETRGLTMASLGPGTQAALRDVAEAGRPTNPLDLSIEAHPLAYAQAVGALLHDPRVDAVLAVYAELGEGAADQVMAVLEGATRCQPAAGGAAGDERDPTPKPLLACVVDADGALPVLADRGVPNYAFPERAARALGQAADRAEWLERPLGRPAPYEIDAEAAHARVERRLAQDGEGWMPAGEAEALLRDAGIVVPPTERCADEEQAVAAAARIGGPVALKAELPPPAYAADLDAVLLGLESEEAVRSGWATLAERVRASRRPWRGAAVQPLVDSGADVLVGAVADPVLGPLVGVGLGGRLADLGGKIAFRLAPRTDIDADELVDAAPGVVAVLTGHRGAPPRDAATLRELVLRFSLLVQALPQLAEVDLNPVRVMSSGAVVLDVRVRVERPAPLEQLRTW